MAGFGGFHMTAMIVLLLKVNNFNNIFMKLTTIEYFYLKHHYIIFIKF